MEPRSPAVGIDPHRPWAYLTPPSFPMQAPSIASSASLAPSAPQSSPVPVMGLRGPTILVAGLITALLRPITAPSPFAKDYELVLRPTVKAPYSVVLGVGDGDVEASLDFAAYALGTSINNAKAKALADRLDHVCQQAFDLYIFTESDSASYFLGTLQTSIRLLIAYYWLKGNMKELESELPRPLEYFMAVKSRSIILLSARGGEWGLCDM